MNRIYPMIILIIALHGCSTLASYEDVSESINYSELIGEEYIANVEFIIHGVNYDDSLQENIDEYVVTTQPGFAGRYVKYYGKLAKKSVIKIIAVKKCLNCYLDFTARVEFEIQIISGHELQGHPIFLTNSFGNNEISEIINGKAIINPSFLLLKKPNKNFKRNKNSWLGSA
ncbi:hypothetical protein [Colwellia hornerae]|uniref:Uncharacterized protein n=1 Tax=Colwellia hornerae TaxID=89402 RepID=A0A5C6QMN4_9GAMM|nr:hypothetical protein [Colwellia hornerae]TWX53615.1 hypothetical protein ESZ28_09000 [Colwellia hornerae]TWX60266.1 hypothetical protein ESZ26_07775 [Colwellia hornerae]TWX70021.1 hypothetical protein ESZ27_04465 [Colwellia hornerae]